MSFLSTIPRPRLIVLAATTFFFAAWTLANLGILTSQQSGWIRFVLTLVFGLLILIRPKPDEDDGPTRTDRTPALIAAITGMILALLGLIFRVHQLEWLGVLLILWGSLRWALPRIYAKDIVAALFLIYWAHPLPAQVFAPLQLQMQRVSVKGAEWLLVGMDVRVWADDLVLRTGFSVYEIPAWCSGMRTATTVMLLGFAVAILNRFRWYECLVVVFAALAQALVLNILRISALVVLIPRVFSRSSSAFLHDTAGVIVLAAIFLVVAEVAAWRRRRTRLDEDSDPGALLVDREIERPVEWRQFKGSQRPLILVVLLLAFGTLITYRNGRVNRLSVLEDIAHSARYAEDYEEALYLSQVVLERSPPGPEWHLNVARLLLLLQRYEDVLQAIDKAPVATERERMEARILRAYALMALGHIDEAADLVRTLPAEVKRANPRVAMILAVVAYHANRPDEVAEHVVRASRWRPNIDRIRMLYPYLRKHRKWDAIRVTNSDIPFRRPASAFSAAEAYMNLDQTPEVGRLTTDAMSAWPSDSRVLEPLFFMAIKRPDSRWEGNFSDQFLRSIATMENPDTLYELFAKCFELGRPDLAWALYRRIETIDSSHPVLAMSLAQYGHHWFLFRRKFLGFPADSSWLRMDIRPHYMLGSFFKSWRPLLNSIPAAEPLVAPDIAGTRRQYLDEALKAFAARHEAGALALPMRYLYAFALEVNGQVPASRDYLRSIADDDPSQEDKVRTALSELYERLGDWENVYETLRGYVDKDDAALPPLLRLGEAELRLRLNLSALYTASRATTLYPRSAGAVALQGKALMQNDAPEQAFFLLRKPHPRHIRELDRLRAEALFETERYREGEAFSRFVLLPLPPVHADSSQRLVLPPAEVGALWHQINTPSEKHFERNAAILQENLPDAKSPFLKDLMTQWLTCYTSRCEGPEADADRWAEIGRDRREQGIALNQLMLLLCRESHFTAARIVAKRAVSCFPEAAPLWLWLISLSGNDPSVLADARKHCPNDPEIWLADLVRRTREEPQTVDPLVNHLLAYREPRYPAETMARAGEYLRRQEMNATACRLIYDAVTRAEGSLPLYILGIRCALETRDRDAAVAWTRHAISASLHVQTGLFRKMVELKTNETGIDADSDMVEALKGLRQDEPDNMLWAQMLGYVRFKRGGWEIMDAYTQMQRVLDAGWTNKLAFTIAAEASRITGNYGRAADILKQARRHHPHNLTFLNNYIYVLTFEDERLPEALDLLPELMTKGGDDLRVLDTAAAVYVGAGETTLADDVIERMLVASEEGDTMWLRAHMHMARLIAAEKDFSRAVRTLEEALRASPGTPDEDVNEASRMLARWRSRQPLLTPPARPLQVITADDFPPGLP